MSSCLLTGAAGFLGHHLHRELARRYDRVVPLDVTGGSGTIKWNLTEERAALSLPGDCEDVYHVAGLAHIVPLTASESDRFFQINARGTANLLAALPNGIRSVTMISTVAVYGREQGVLLDEETPRAAVDPYGASKRQAEDLFLEWGRLHQVRVTLFRLPLVAGPGAPGNLGAMVRALRKGLYCGIAPGTARRSVVNVTDVAGIIVDAARIGGVYHLTDGYHPTLRELEIGLSKALGRRPPLVLPRAIARTAAAAGDAAERILRRNPPFNSRAFTKLTSTLTYSDAKARTALNWRPRPVLETLSEIVAQ
jgi:nucleoside-diphosphate-sugar epimerase